MKVLFLVIDGVLNNDFTREVCEGFTFVEDGKALLLKELIDQTGAKVVPLSTWRRGWECKERVQEPTPSDWIDIRLFDALDEKLQEHGIELLSYTEDFGRRSEEIDLWLRQWTGEPIESVVILDDMGGAEMRPHARYLVQTDFRDGLLPKHVQKAAEMLTAPAAPVETDSELIWI